MARVGFNYAVCAPRHKFCLYIMLALCLTPIMLRKPRLIKLRLTKFYVCEMSLMWTRAAVHIHYLWASLASYVYSEYIAILMIILLRRPSKELMVSVS